MCFLDNNKRIGVNIHDQLLQFRDLLLFHSCQNDLGRLMAVGAFTVQMLMPFSCRRRKV